MEDYKVWDYWADKYEKLWVQKYSLGPTRREIIKELESIIISGNRYKILDMGCGTGQLLREIKERFSGVNLELTGVDVAEKMIEEARLRSEGIEYSSDSVDSFKEAQNSFDIILCSHSFPYYPDKQKVVEKFSRLLKKGGWLMLAQASVNNFYDKIVMNLVKLTTSQASYPSLKEIHKMFSNEFDEMKDIKIKEKFFMPSIYLFISQKR